MEIEHLSHVPLEKAAKKAAAALQQGRIILYPTDTVYGLGVDALNPEAIRAVQALKGRTTVWPLLMVVPDIATIEKYAILNENARMLAERFLPGPLSLVLPAKDMLPPELTLNGTVGIRIPKNPFCLALAREFGRPYTSTSANKTKRETPTTVHGVIAQLGHDAHEIAIAVDDGERVGGKPSTVVSCIDGAVHILREGAITRAELGL